MLEQPWNLERPSKFFSNDILVLAAESVGAPPCSSGELLVWCGVEDIAFVEETTMCLKTVQELLLAGWGHRHRALGNELL